MNIKSYLTAITLLLSLPLVMEPMEKQGQKSIEAMEELVLKHSQRIANLEKTRVYLREKLESQRENAPMENQAAIAQMQQQYDDQQREIDTMKSFLKNHQNFLNEKKSREVNDNNN